MNWPWLLLKILILPLVVGQETRCLSNYTEVHPKKYFHYEGKNLDIVVETSDRITHQLSTWVFYYFLKEVVGYPKIKIVHEPDNFNVERVITRLTDSRSPTGIANTTINLEVWIPPDYDTYATEFVKDCGNVSPPGRFGWFIPLQLSLPIRSYYNPDNRNDIKSIHWRYFRDAKFVQLFDIDWGLLRKIVGENRDNVCPPENCTENMFIPPQCERNKCAILLAPNWNAASFVTEHIKENQLLVKVLFLGWDLGKAVEKLKQEYLRRGSQKSIVILSWTPSEVILYERNFVTVSFENCERLNFTHALNTGYKYEMHRLVKIAWEKVEKGAEPLYDVIRTFKFEEAEYDHLLGLYEQNRLNLSLKEIACEWMWQKQNVWMSWKKDTTNIIYIGGIFPMSYSSYKGRGIVRAAKSAVYAINKNETLLADYNLQLLVTDGRCQPNEVMFHFIEFIVEPKYYKNLVGVLGPACSDTVEPLAGVSKHYHIAVISYSAEGSSFSNREKYPYFFRTIGENRHYKHVYLELFNRMNWKRVAALTEDGQKYTEYISLMQDELEQNKITFIANKKFPRERESEHMTRYLEDLKEKRARIIIADVVDEIARQVMCEAYKLKMTARQGYVWFLPMWLDKEWYKTDMFNQKKNESVNCTTSEMIQAATGYFSMTHAYYAPENQLMQENKTVGQWIQEYQKPIWNITPEVSDYGGFAYDAVWVYALALDKLSKTDPESLSDIHSENTTNKLVKLIEQTDFYGVSGRIKFRGGPSRFSVITLLQWYSNSSHLIGEFYPNLTDDKPEILGGKLTLNDSKIRWFTPDGRIPDDGTLPPPVCAIDSIAKAFNVECQTAVIILNIMVAVLLGVTVMGVCFYLKHKYDQKIEQQKAFMKQLGLRYDRKDRVEDLEDLEVSRTQIRLNRRLGEGAFGTVYGGEADVPGIGWCPVAVKSLKRGSTTDDKIDFLAEADNMKRFDHKNIVKLLGVITKTEPLHTLMEFCLYGDLKNFLLARRHLATDRNQEGYDEVAPKRLTNMAMDVARGLSYLASMKYVHRDLACRNCLINAQRVVKIGDFGMTRPVAENYECYRFTRKGMLPVRWMAPESLMAGVFTPASDMWSYGVVLWEIITFGCTPWYGKANTEVVELVKKGQHIDVPKDAKPQLEGLMKSCWDPDPKKRPPASQIVDYVANNPRLLQACTDVPLQSFILPDFVDDHEEPGGRKRIGSTNSDLDSPKVLVEPSFNGSFSAAINEPCVSIPLENCCPKVPLLGASKSANCLIHFGKFNMQTRRESMSMSMDDDDEGFITNSPSNGYINSKL